MNRIFISFLLLAAFSLSAYSQVPLNIGIQILKAEDARRYDATIEKLLSDPSDAVRKRAALAAGRIGSEAAILALTSLLEKEKSEQVRAMAAFALGEIESIKAADAILKALQDTKTAAPVRARAVEAAGKIAAANPKDEKSKALGEAILNVLTNEDSKQPAPSTDVVPLGLTAVLRARPTGAEDIVRKFLAYSDPAVVADALNTLTRLKAKNANRDARDLLETSVHALIRANAARLLGAAEDKEAVDILLKAAVNDSDSRVRVSAIRTLGSLKDPKAAHGLIAQFRRLLADYSAAKRTQTEPKEKNEILEIENTLARLLENTDDIDAAELLNSFRKADGYRSSETEVALATIAPRFYYENEVQYLTAIKQADPRTAAAIFQGYGRLKSLERNDKYKDIVRETNYRLLKFAEGWFWNEDKSKSSFPIPELLRAFTADKQDQSGGFLRPMLERERGVFIRTTLVELIADQPTSKENVEALKKAFDYALLKDKDYDDAQLAILDALYKLDKKESVGTLLVALSAPDFLVRKKAFELLSDKDLQKDFPGIATSLENARKNHKDQVLPYAPAFGTKLGQVLNTDADYRRALSRKNGSVKAVLTTEKGTFTIDLLPKDAPLTVDNFIKLARSNYFNGVEVHRVVPNFVMQDGDPRGDGNGGPGWSIRCEINMVPYERGAVGMALSGKDTGGSQWFVTHSPQPHLDGGYTVFGRVNETGMKVVDNIVRGDKIITVKIIEGNSPQRHRGH